jgi:hypothetical protein
MLRLENAGRYKHSSRHAMLHKAKRRLECNRQITTEDPVSTVLHLPDGFTDWSKDANHNGEAATELDRHDTPS